MLICYGGTFDPPHKGHLAAAREVLERTAADSLRMIPCNVPPHRAQPEADAADRLAMVRLAAGEVRGLEVDDRELQRPGPSYTVDTLLSLRRELGHVVALGWVIGSDAVAGLENWSRWQQLLELTHLLVLDRPGATLPDAGPVAAMLQQARCESVAALREEPAGRVWHVQQRPVDVSASEIRASLQAGDSAGHLLPASVWAYIRRKGLYGVATGDANLESE